MYARDKELLILVSFSGFGIIYKDKFHGVIKWTNKTNFFWKNPWFFVWNDVMSWTLFFLRTFLSLLVWPAFSNTFILSFCIYLDLNAKFSTTCVRRRLYLVYVHVDPKIDSAGDVRLLFYTNIWKKKIISFEINMHYLFQMKIVRIYSEYILWYSL